MVIAGDFNLDLASAARELHTTERLLGGRMKEGNGSENAKLLIDFCTGNKLTIPQTFGRRSEVADSSAWETWRHPGTGNQHVKDLILIPKGQTKCIQNCGPAFGGEMIVSDHKPVVCKWLPQSHKIYQAKPSEQEIK